MSRKYFSSEATVAVAQHFKTMGKKELLILAVQNYPTLWDMSQQSYHDNTAKENCWKKVSQECGCSNYAACRIQWRYLKDKFRREKNKNQSRSGDPAKVASPWPLFRTMEFILPQMKTKPTTSNIKMVEDSTTEQPDLDSCDTRIHQSNAEDEDLFVSYLSDNDPDRTNLTIEEGSNSFKPIHPDGSATPSLKGSSRTDSSEMSLPVRTVASSTQKSWPKQSYKRKRAELQDTTEMLKQVLKDTSYDKENDPVSMFFASVSQQVSAANLTPTKFMNLQIGVLNLLKKVTETQNDD